MTQHPNVHQAFQSWSEDQVLHVAAVYSNPLRYRVRREMMHDFRQYMAASKNVALYVGEVAFGDRPFEVTSADNPLDLQLRTNCELWVKENVTNLLAQRFPVGWKYGAQIDADLHFTRPDWALEAIHQLQHFPWVQVFSSFSALGPQHVPVRLLPSFAYSYVHYRPATNWKASAKAAPRSLGFRAVSSDAAAATRSASWPDNPGAPGGGWAFTADGFNTTGGFLDTCILGSADTHMAFGLACEPDNSIELRKCSQGYIDSVRRWQERAAKLHGDIGVVENHAIHYFHGSYQRRVYGDRWQVLRDNNFDPLVDIQRDSQGLLILSGGKPRLRDDIRAYFRSRNEDIGALEGESHLV
jgi:hypothetical protein